MTEQEWLTSSDPVAMLDWLLANHKPSDRKLRLIASVASKCCRCQWHKSEAFEDGGEYDGSSFVGGSPWREVTPRWVYHAVSQPGVSGDQIAHILRDIIGNPFRPVTLPVGEVCGACEGTGIEIDIGSVRVKERDCAACHGTGHGPSPVLTPLVLSIAKAAYAERNPDGTLDDATLAILADALEDVGLPGEVECDHVAENPRRRPGGQTLPACHRCPNGIQPHPILAALRSPGPHYPGFWALDVVLGRS